MTSLVNKLDLMTLNDNISRNDLFGYICRVKKAKAHFLCEIILLLSWRVIKKLKSHNLNSWSIIKNPDCHDVLLNIMFVLHLYCWSIIKHDWMTYIFINISCNCSKVDVNTFTSSQNFSVLLGQSQSLTLK